MNDPTTVQAASPHKPDIGYLPTPPEVVDAVLTLTQAAETDVLYDLGSGDGRIVIAAAQSGARGVGIDVDSSRLSEAEANAQQAGVSDRVEFRLENLFHSQFSDATIVMLYLLPHLNLKLRSQLFRQLKPGTQVVSYNFDMGDWHPDRVVEVAASEESTLYYWVIPATIPEHLL